MIIVKTVKEAVQLTSGFITTYFPIQKKKNALELNQNYTNIINLGRSYGTKTVIGFWYPQALLNYLDSTLATELNLEWDTAGCVYWAQSQNVDIAIVPDCDYEIDISNLIYYRKKINRIWNNEQYEKYFVSPTESHKTKILCLALLTNKNSWKYVSSWGDGITRYIEADFMSKYTNNRMLIVDPVKSSDGLLYSSSYFLYTPEEKTELVKIEQAVLTSDLSGLDPVGIVADNIRGAITDPSFVLQGANVTSDARFLGPATKIVDVKFSIGIGEDLKYDHYAFLV
jgi:hypothetical protein